MIFNQIYFYLYLENLAFYFLLIIILKFKFKTKLQKKKKIKTKFLVADTIQLVFKNMEKKVIRLPITNKTYNFTFIND